MGETATPAGPIGKQAPRRKLIIPLVVILLILAVGFFAYRSWITQPTDPLTATSNLISESEFEERHGLQVRLIGVTAAGGMIDFRLKMIDPDKARAFLQEPANLPITMIAEDGSQLLAADEMDEEITWEEGGILFILLRNNGGVVQPGAEVIIEFGDSRLEPMLAQ